MKTLLLTPLFAASVAGATDFDTSVTHIQPQPGNKNPATAGRKVDRAYAYGFSLALNDPHLITTPAFGSADTVYLDSMTLLNRSFHKEKRLNEGGHLHSKQSIRGPFERIHRLAVPQQSQYLNLQWSSSESQRNIQIPVCRFRSLTIHAEIPIRTTSRNTENWH